MRIQLKRMIISNALLIIALFSFSIVSASEKDNHKENKDVHEKEFNPGTMIIEHIVDAYEWHILSYKNTHVSVPLPIILYDKGKITAFFSSKFHHGHKSYKGYKIETEGKNKGKIVAVKDNSLISDKDAVLPLDFSITKTTMGVFISIILLCFIFISVAKSYKKRKGEAPKGLQSLMEPVIIFIRDDIAKSSIGEKKYKKYMPFLLTVFFFIFFNNLLGLIPIFPGGANVTGNISVTLVLAVFTFVITTFSGNKNYWKHIFNAPGVPWWLKIPIPLMPIIEIVGVFTKPFVLMIRLFANISAGHIVTLGFISIIFIFGNISPGLGYGVSFVSIIFAIFITFLEFLVALIQAYVFTLLSALYLGMATEEHH